MPEITTTEITPVKEWSSYELREGELVLGHVTVTHNHDEPTTIELDLVEGWTATQLRATADAMDKLDAAKTNAL